MATMVFPGRYESLAQIAEVVQQATRELGLDPLNAYAVETAVDEACSNIIEHAYGGETDKEIEFSYQVINDELIITLRDYGKQFNPKKIKRPNLSADIKERKAHGLGLYFMYQWMDAVTFEFINNQNVLTMVKRKGNAVG